MPIRPGSTPAPTAATTPQTSWPIVTGGSHAYSPASMCRSVPQMPAARTPEQHLAGAGLPLLALQQAHVPGAGCELCDADHGSPSP